MIAPVAFKNHTVRNALLNNLIVNATIKKILYYPFTVLIFFRQTQYLWLIFFFFFRWRRPICQFFSRKDFHCVHKRIVPDFYQIVKRIITAETLRPPKPFAIGHFQAVVVNGTIYISRSFNFLNIIRLKLSQISEQVYLPHLFNNLRLNIWHIKSYLS